MTNITKYVHVGIMNAEGELRGSTPFSIKIVKYKNDGQSSLCVLTTISETGSISERTYELPCKGRRKKTKKNTQD